MSKMLGPFALGRVHHADCLDALRLFPAESVQCCVTSPPYWGLRKYDVPDLVWGGDAACAHEWEGNGEKTTQPKRDHGHGGFDNATGTRGEQGNNAASGGSRSLGSTCPLCGAWRGQLGLEPTPDLYVSHIVGIFSEVRRVLRDDGTVWCNIGDSWNSGTTAPRRPSKTAQHGYWTNENITRRVATSDCKPKDLIGVPWLLAFALRADGWFLRAEIIWHKVACMPESVRDRPTRAHEQVFLLSKSGTYFYNEAEAHEPAITDDRPRTTWNDRRESEPPRRADPAQSGHITHTGTLASSPGRNWRTVWTIGPEPNNAQHYVPFPRELARRCIVAGSRVGDVVLDPFAGTGTTVRVADGLGRKALGFDLGEKYVEQANERSGEVRPAEAKQGQQCGIFAEVKP